MRNNQPPIPGTLLQSVQNALKILQMLEHKPRIKASEIAEELKLGRSTVHRLIATLEYEGFLRKDSFYGGYRAGRALVTIGLSSVSDIDVRKKAHKHMEALAAATGETVHLFVLEGGNARIVDGVVSPQMVRVATAVGALYPAHATAGGKALLASLNTEHLHDLYSRGLTKFTESTNTHWSSFEAELDLIRRSGYAVNRGEAQDGVCGVAVPILDRKRHLVASLAVSVPSDRISEEKIHDLATQLHARANEISAVIG